MMIERPRVSAFGLAVRQGLWVPVLVAIVALGMFAYAREMSIEARLMASEGIETTGQVIGREQRRSSASDGGTSIRYYLRYQFTPLDGQRRVGRQQVSKALHDRVRVNMPITVRYASSRPSVNRVERESTIGVRLLLNIGSSLLAMFAAFTAWAVWGDWRAMLRAVRKGEPGEAWVVGWRDVNEKPRKDGKPPHRIMEWRDEGRNLLGSTGGLKPALAERFPPGSPIRLWYDPRTGRGFWEESIMPGSAAARDVDGAPTAPQSQSSAAKPPDTRSD
ncbi:MAG: DUF3592 domain-containing protein [Pararhodobacter sp.]|nr:DUF3592 domain-containing protein [Pararhodobacter sp.]